MKTEYQSNACKECTIGYGLDGGGYEFEVFKGFWGDSVVCWDDPDFDYFPFPEAMPRHIKRHLFGVVVLFHPTWGFGSEHKFPLLIIRKNGEKLRRISCGWLNETDRDCHCHGEFDRSGQWEFTGNVTDTPYADCERCNGDGYVISPGGQWAIYAQVEK